MGISLIIYIVSISLQIAGALMLIIFAISTKRKDVIKSFATSHVIQKNGETKELIYNHKAFLDTYRTAFYSKISVAFIATGYLLGVFGEIEGSRWLIVLLIAVLTTVIIVIVKIVVEKLLQKSDRPITSRDLDEIGVEPEIETMSKEELEMILNAIDEEILVESSERENLGNLSRR